MLCPAIAAITARKQRYVSLDWVGFDRWMKGRVAKPTWNSGLSALYGGRARARSPQGTKGLTQYRGVEGTEKGRVYWEGLGNRFILTVGFISCRKERSSPSWTFQYRKWLQKSKAKSVSDRTRTACSTSVKISIKSLLDSIATKANDCCQGNSCPSQESVSFDCQTNSD